MPSPIHHIAGTTVTMVTPIPPTSIIEADLVLEGGITLGASYIGSLNLIHKTGIRFRRIAGTSAGAITGALIASGFSPDEIEWLMSNVKNPRVHPKPITLNSGHRSIDFMEFLDFPNVDDISQATKEKTLLWNLLKGQIIDELCKINIPGIPTRSSAVNSVISVIPLPDVVRNTLIPIFNGIFNFLPTKTPTLGDFMPIKTGALRKELANSIWNSIAAINPLLMLEAQFIHEGSFFEGNKFISIMNRLISSKIFGSGSTQIVKFNNLPIELVVMAYDYISGQPVVYGRQTHPNMSVVEAVRRSMSMPLVFQPRKTHPNNNPSRESIIDGGVASNFPVWLFTNAANQYWTDAVRDNNSNPRIKIGLSLNDNKEAPANWNPRKSKYSGKPSFSEIFLSIIAKKLELQNIHDPKTFPDAQLNLGLKNLKFIEVLLGYLSVDKETVLREELIKGLMKDYNYFDVEVPLLGFSGWDFAINSELDDIKSIAGRGYMAALNSLSRNPLTGNINPIVSNVVNFQNQNPY